MHFLVKQPNQFFRVALTKLEQVLISVVVLWSPLPNARSFNVFSHLSLLFNRLKASFFLLPSQYMAISLWSIPHLFLHCFLCRTITHIPKRLLAFFRSSTIAIEHISFSLVFTLRIELFVSTCFFSRRKFILFFTPKFNGIAFRMSYHIQWCLYLIRDVSFKSMNWFLRSNVGC